MKLTFKRFICLAIGVWIFCGAIIYNISFQECLGVNGGDRGYCLQPFKEDKQPIKPEEHGDDTAYTAAQIKDITCLAKNIYHEARGEDEIEQIAVAEVTMNRVETAHRGAKNVCEVVYDPYQFSWTLDKKLWNIDDKKSWKKAVTIAINAYHRRYREVTKGSTHYHTRKVSPKWAKGRKPTIKLTHNYYSMEGK